ncbi:hypothetical protein EPUS_07044 [Endocarpon pusillum Z07020]|uniref:CorA-like transporter domain-containing protein n=1 Tax=Endocarpon pusillum (strain Z07020 / HMAS-L-300199) TaxID=1263415 RepID=U1GCK9_ENDPU|nr:uncharacterized protein EPUS_07044 [Endocarpon pusillum Z07020]ERF69788.1 hypothetical protein EPUS_07044 [Endocarpon pusillum Z07020]
MAHLQLSQAFEQSYKSFEAYPCNLVYQPSYLGVLKAYRDRLNNAAAKLFTANNGEVYIPFRDLLPNEQAFEKRNIFDDEALKDWIGDRSTVDSLTSTPVGDLATRRDPKCRFVFLWGGHSRRPLNITRQMLIRIASYHQVMPEYLDFISVFGQQSSSRELRFSGFREQVLLSKPVKGLSMPSLGRSGRQYQLCYNLKSVACLSAADTTLKQKEWSIRQAAFYHQFDVGHGTTLWIVTKGDLEIKERLQEMTGKDGRPEDRAFGTPEECFRSSLAVHLLYCHWSTEAWRWYLQWLEDVTDHESHIAVLGPRDPSRARREYTPEDLQTLHHYEEKTHEAIMILEANAGILTSLRSFYTRLVDRRDFSLQGNCQEDVLTFAARVDDMVHDSKMQLSRARLLSRIVADRKNLILQHLQHQATEKMEALTMSTYNTGVMSQKEAIAVRIITVVTLVYLPATFVSTFFSTDVIRFQNQNGNSDATSGLATSPNETFYGSFSKIALFRWLQVTLPLSALTLAIGYIAFRIADKKRKRASLPLYWTASKADTS